MLIQGKSVRVYRRVVFACACGQGWLRARSALNSVGDTIVEVLIAISVISLVLVGAYQTTNHNVANVQDAQERSQAVKLVQSQIEYLRRAGSIHSGNCLSSSGEETYAGGQGSNPCIVTSDGTKALATDQPAYRLKISNTSTPGVYAIVAQWDSLVSSSVQDNVTMFYHP